MVSIFLREQKRYTQEYLVKSFQCSEEKAIHILKRLKEFGVVKTVKATEEQKDLTDLLNEDVEITDIEIGRNEYFYVCTFVGVITVEGIVLKCYPKYLTDTTEPKEELKQILKVLEKYNSQEQIVRVYNENDENNTFNMLAAILYLLQDYYEYGSYSNVEDIIEINGSGEILWDKTINETVALISNNRPYYPELLTRKRINNDFDYFKRLHECILTQGSLELKNADLLELFGIMGVEISDEKLDDFGEKEYILERIEKEGNIQFNTRKQLLLKIMHGYIAHNGSLNDDECLSMFGTNSFNLVWEKVCAEVMDNQLQRPLGALDLPTKLADGYNKNDLLISLIERPTWYGMNKGGGIFNKTAKDTLIPDMISIINANDESQFIIFDAKYYSMQLEEDKILRGQPGIESITKQYLYQLAYQKFVDAHKITKVRNCFLMPTEGSEIVNKGYVAIEMMNGIGLEDIQTRLLPAVMMYSHYIQDKKMDLEFFKSLKL